MRRQSWMILAIALASGTVALAQMPTYNLGRPPAPDELGDYLRHEGIEAAASDGIGPVARFDGVAARVLGGREEGLAEALARRTVQGAARSFLVTLALLFH